MFKTNILFTGFYGQKNTGDDAFVEVSSWGARKYWRNNDNIFLGRQETLPLTQGEIKGYPFSIPKTYHAQSLFLLKYASHLISAGGSTMHSALAPNNIKALGLKRKIKRKKPKMGGIGVSIGPFKSIKDERAVIEYLKNLDFLAVRDQASYDIVAQLNLPYKPINAFDLAALLPRVYSSFDMPRRQQEKKVIGISVCPFESISNQGDLANEHKRNRMLCQLLQELDHQADVHFKFLVINGHERSGDLSTTLKLVQQAKLKSTEIVPYQRETRAMWDEIRGCDFVISTRLHAAIFACFADIPFMLNEYHKKCNDFLETIGYESTYRLYDSHYCIKEKSEQILEILNKNNYIAPSLKDVAIAKSELNFTMVDI